MTLRTTAIWTVLSMSHHYERSPAERSLQARAAAHARWARTADRAVATAPARAAFEARFEDEVDPDRRLTPQERARRVEHARAAYFADLSVRSARARRRRRQGTLGSR